MNAYLYAVDTARLMKADARWPFFNRHLDAVCPRCADQLCEHSVSGFAPMHGAFRGVCPRCDAPSWYDCAEGTVEMIQAREWMERQFSSASPIPKDQT